MEILSTGNNFIKIDTFLLPEKTTYKNFNNVIIINKLN